MGGGSSLRKPTHASAKRRMKSLQKNLGTPLTHQKTRIRSSMKSLGTPPTAQRRIAGSP
jgi:hypothetical protein